MRRNDGAESRWCDEEDADMDDRNAGKRFAMALLLMLASTQALAATVSGVKLEDQVTVNGSSLVLNGAGLRTKYLLANVYVAALYLPQKSGDADGIIGAAELRRISLTMKRDVGTATMTKAFHEGVSNNLSAAELTALKPKLDQLDQSFHKVTALKSGDVIALDFGADGSTRVSYNGQLQDSIAGADLSAALLKIWLGSKPVQDDLKRALLGAASAA
jgi:hypothetical protein